jgi:nicotinamidase-related amidase
MADTALLIIDMQVGNFSESNPIYNGNKLLAKVKSLIVKGRAAQILWAFTSFLGELGIPITHANRL